jgi:hypothetical protein
MTLPVIGATAANGEMQQLWPSFAPEIQLNLYYADGTGSCPPRAINVESAELGI